MKRTVDRCKLCGAPLAGDLSAPVITCRYCEAENRVDARASSAEIAEAVRHGENAAAAAQEARAMAPIVQARAAEIEPRMHAAVALARTSEDPDERAEAKAEATRLFEAFFRLQQMPGLLIARAAGPHGEQMLRDVDAATENAVAQFAAGLE